MSERDVNTTLEWVITLGEAEVLPPIVLANSLEATIVDVDLTLVDDIDE